MRKISVGVWVLWFGMCSGAVAAENNWPQFRGRGGSGIAEGSRFPEHWSATEQVAWKRDILGRGWSSPIVWGDRVVLTTGVNLGESEPLKKGLYFGGDRPEPPKSVHQWKVLCLDLKTGEVLWDRLIQEAKPETAIHLKNSYASETPVTDGERIYTWFGSAGLFCFDFAGQTVWSNRFQPARTRAGWGTAASPVLHNDRLYLVNDNEDQSWLAAFDKTTGREIWKVPREEKSNWSTPLIWENSQRAEIVTAGSRQVRSYDLEGRLLWSLKGMSTIAIPTSLADGDLAFISSGFVADKLRPVYAIRAGATGDISLPPGATNNAFVAWSHPTAGAYNPSPLVYRGRLYVLLDRGLLSCFDAKTGRQFYDRERLPEAFAFTASPWAANGLIYCLNENGITYVLKAGDQFELLHMNRLADDDTCLATPAVSGDRLIIRTSARVYCIR